MQWFFIDLYFWEAIDNVSYFIPDFTTLSLLAPPTLGLALQFS